MVKPFQVLLFLLVCLLVWAMPVSAAIDTYQFPDKEMQLRYEQLIAELRCPQCLNTNLAGSDAMIAQDLKREVHRMLIQGYSNREIMDFMHARYGDFILYSPRVSASTWLLWFSPLIFLGLAGLVWFRMTRNQKAEAAALSDADREKIDQLLQSRQP